VTLGVREQTRKVEVGMSERNEGVRVGQLRCDAGREGRCAISLAKPSP
jgi:hypothetical protein